VMSKIKALELEKKPFQGILTYQWHFFHLRPIIRAGIAPESQHWDLRFRFPDGTFMHFVCEYDIQKFKAVSAYTKKMVKPEEAMKVGGTIEKPEYFPPGTLWNPYKARHAFVVALEKELPVIIYEKTPTFIKFLAKGDYLSGLFVLKREDMSEWWIIERAERPKPLERVTAGT